MVYLTNQFLFDTKIVTTWECMGYIVRYFINSFILVIIKVWVNKTENRTRIAMIEECRCLISPDCSKRNHFRLSCNESYYVIFDSDLY